MTFDTRMWASFWIKFKLPWLNMNFVEMIRWFDFLKINFRSPTIHFRYKMVSGIKWVDEVVEGAPYVTTLETLDAHDCDFCVHGGKLHSTYSSLAWKMKIWLNSFRFQMISQWPLTVSTHTKLWKMPNDTSMPRRHKLTYALCVFDATLTISRITFCREVSRTEGISTTDLVGRMLLLTKNHFRQGENEYAIEKEGDRSISIVNNRKMNSQKLTKIDINCNLIVGSSNLGQDHSARSPWTGCSQFLPTTQKIIQFSDGKAPKPTDKIVSLVHPCTMFPWIFTSPTRCSFTCYFHCRCMLLVPLICSTSDIWISSRRPKSSVII